MKAVKANGNSGLENIPTAQSLWDFLALCLRQPLDVQSRIVAVTRLRIKDVRAGYYGEKPLPREMTSSERTRLGSDLAAFAFALSVVGGDPQYSGYSTRAAIADLMPAASGLN